jgi:AraC-like DNA-binding protein
MESLCVHLTTHQSLVWAGTEISLPAAGWLFLRICSGGGYLMNGATHQEIRPGDLVVIPADAQASLRASQLGDLCVCHFGIRPEQLTGFFTAEEQQALNPATRNNLNGLQTTRLFERDTVAARLQANLCDLRQQEPGVLVRAAMLAVAVQALRDLLTQVSTPSAAANSAEEKLAALVGRIPESELLRRSVKELARDCGCSERHLRRLYAERFGMSLLRRQIEWRIERAKQLLLETDAKIIDIAEQCGFRSLGLFNATFKRLTRLTPGTWRVAFAATKMKYQRQHPSRCPKLARQRRKQA